MSGSDQQENYGIDMNQMQQMIQQMQSQNSQNSNTNNSQGVAHANSSVTLPHNLSYETEVSFDQAYELLKKASHCKAEYCDNLLIGCVDNPSRGKDMFGNEFITVNVQYYAPFGSKEYTLCEESYKINQYYGKIKLRELTVYPVLNLESDDDVGTLIARGMQFMEYTQKPFYAHANGYMYVLSQQGFNRLPIDSRVVIDPSGYKRLYANRWHDKEPMDKIPEELLFTALPTVPVFSLEYRRWGEVPVYSLGDIQFDKTAFNRTVLPEDYKNVITPLVTNFYKTDCIDFIAGKKKGLVFLLGGKPGTGKTLTALALAELTEKPLYCIGSGDLGTEPDQIDKNLSNIFNMVSKWGGMVLIDEADVFMSKRTDYNIDYNACVSVFLRLIETYTGILFLTTNKNHAKIDPAFDSRIHIRLHYRSLDESGREQVWKEAFKRYGIENVDTNAISQYELNNREIANIVQTVFVTVGGNAEDVTTDKVQSFVKLRLDFNTNEDYDTFEKSNDEGSLEQESDNDGESINGVYENEKAEE